jgi:predicted MFS family arabinose efflux permease
VAIWCALAIALGTAARALGCPMCGAALENDPVADAFNWSILFMMAMPYTLLTLAGLWLYVSHRRASTGRRASVLKLPVMGPKEV